MIKIDLLVNKNGKEFYLSDNNIKIIDIDYSSSNLEIDRRVIKNRSGYINAGSRYNNKTIQVAGRIRASSLKQYHDIKDKLNGLFVDEEAYYITPILPGSDDLYQFELPGQKRGEVFKDNATGTSLGYRFKAISEEGVNTEFIGKIKNSLLFNFRIEFITAELPFGETIPYDRNVTSKTFKYNGTAENSQLEYNWKLRLISNISQTGKFTINLDGREFIYDSDITINNGDVFVIGAIGTTMNGDEVTSYTNYEYLVLKPLSEGMNTIQTGFSGSIEIIDYVEFYK